MPYHFNISKINDPDEEEQLPKNENDEIDIDELGERDYYEATHICDHCFGIGDWCGHCNGTGTIKKRKY